MTDNSLDLIVDTLREVALKGVDNDKAIITLVEAVIRRVVELRESMTEYQRVTDIRINELESRVDALEYQKKNEKIH